MAKIKKEPLQILTIPVSAACVGWITNKAWHEYECYEAFWSKNKNDFRVLHPLADLSSGPLNFVIGLSLFPLSRAMGKVC